MKHKTALLAAVAAVILAGLAAACNQQKKAASAAQQKQLATLKDLRDSGVLSEEEYQVKSQAIIAATPPVQSESVFGSVLGSGTRTVEITDPVLNMTAETLVIPADWKFAGTVARIPNCTSSGASVRYTAQSADGSTASEMFSGYSWSWYSDSNMANAVKQRGCAVLPIVTAADFLKQVMIANLRPNAQVIEIGPLAPAFQAAIEEQLKKRREANAQVAASYGQPPQQLVYEGARAHIAYTRAGQPVEERLVAVIQCTISHQGAMFNRPASQTNQCSTVVMGVQRAPQGKLESMQPVFAKIVPTINQAWDQRISQIIQQQGQQAINASWAAHNQMMKQGEAFGKQMTAQHNAFMQQQQVSHDKFMKQQQVARDARQHQTEQTIQMIQGVGTYTNPNTGERAVVTNPNQHTFQGSDGTLVNTNDANWDKNEKNTNNTWTEMVPTP
ncbi:MAG: SHOCT domain-containing protein [Terriglobales bacterium]